MAMIHLFMVLVFDVSCIFNAYLDACVKDYAMSSPSDLGEKTPA